MSLNKPEAELWQQVRSEMSGHWLATRHEDGEISPGVPDIHYVLLSGDRRYRVGWLELKIIYAVSKNKHRVRIEPSQHQYIRRWGSHMPIHFLIGTASRVYLIDSIYHDVVSDISDYRELKLISVDHFNNTDIGTRLPPLLRNITRI